MNQNTKALITLSILLACVGLGALSQATLGVGLVALAAVFGIWARIAQAASETRS